MENKLESIPEVGKYYHFFDDGKLSPSRHYICRVERLLSKEEANEIMVEVPYWNPITNEDETITMTLFERWQEEKESVSFLYSEDTDYFVELSCPEYDNNNLYAVRTKDGVWFTIAVQDFWQTGRLDVTGKKYQHCIDSWGDDDWKEKYPPADEEHYMKRF